MNVLKHFISAVAILSAATLPIVSSAHGCVKGAVVGVVAGHVAGHHAVAGAVVGCAIGHHQAKVKERQAAETQSNAKKFVSAAPAQPDWN